jgi:hypothetical protein
MAADIFISYKREERSQVERLTTALRGLGFSVWFDASLSAGEMFTDEIDREVRAAKVVLVCWSPGAASSQWVKAEAQIGFSKSNLISARVAGPDGFEPPVPFNSVHMEDLSAWVQQPSGTDPAWKSVLRRLGVLTGRTDVADWGAVPVDADAAAIQAWFAKHGATSPLVLDAEAALTHAEARGQARAEAQAAARERLARAAAEERAERERKATARAEQDAAETAARGGLEAAEPRAGEAETRGALQQRESVIDELARWDLENGKKAAAICILLGIGGAVLSTLYGQIPRVFWMLGLTLCFFSWVPMIVWHIGRKKNRKLHYLMIERHKITDQEIHDRRTSLANKS